MWSGHYSGQFCPVARMTLTWTARFFSSFQPHQWRRRRTHKETGGAEQERQPGTHQEKPHEVGECGALYTRWLVSF